MEAGLKSGKNLLVKRSAGILLYRTSKDQPQVMLVHPGGPFWARKDIGSWSIPKGEFDEEEDPLEAAKREFYEETGVKLSERDYIPLAPVKQKSSKLIFAWALEKDMDVSQISSNLFEMEWPPHSGKKQEFPEVDKGDWFSLDEAREKITPGQIPFLDELALHKAWK